MKPSSILTADILDIIFDGRNKEYGAYELRKHYNRRVWLGVTLMLLLCLLFVAGCALFDTEKPRALEMSYITCPVLPPDSLILVPPVPVPQIALQPALPMTTGCYNMPFIVPDEPLPAATLLGDSNRKEQVEIVTIHSGGHSCLDVLPSMPGPAEEKKAAKEPDIIMCGQVEIEAYYPGGRQAWECFLQENMRYPDAAEAGCIEGIVLVQFIVDSSGLVDRVEAISGPEILRAEAAQVIRKSGNWKPATMNGRKVRSYKRQPIIFRLVEE
ncbi:MAG: energy transducer TonB [Candidatus Pseudobacter hemicellulosilyticus]|uniref:Energy transducer TonB n=1 Tax=Candidatus Pseudobacter hemicellulosilyticus TaxID=3121375 RepID=A0AAJ5WT94_9BACT|nr:MAG: energy transducer TonB [Pseudobacter sp.]